MTEEIIIDGVNVAECGAYKDKHCKDKTSIMFCDTNLCSNYPYCYFKQLKRLEFELKVTKADYEASEQVNKELKKQIESQKGLITVGGKQQYEMTIAYDKCKSALEEIRNIILRDNSMIIDKEVYFELQCGEPVAFKLQKIFNLINEVLGC